MNPWSPADHGIFTAGAFSAVTTSALTASGSTTGVPNDVIVLFFVTSGATVTGITTGTGVQDAWVLLGRSTGTGVNVESWISRGNGTTTSMGTATFSASTTGHVCAYGFRFPQPITTLPTVSVTATTGTGNTTSPGGVTVAVGGLNAGVNDILIEHIGWASTTAETAVVDSPSAATTGSNRWGQRFSTAATTLVRHAVAMKGVTSQDATGNYSRANTLAASTQWAAYAFALGGPPAGDAALSGTGLVYKGRDTAALDQAATA